MAFNSEFSITARTDAALPFKPVRNWMLFLYTEKQKGRFFGSSVRNEVPLNSVHK
ncbi:hypothetical protein ACE6H2_013949 [Prunus campanulata]